MLGKRGVRALHSSDYENNDADQGILAAMYAARHEIKLETPNLNSDSVLKAIRDAAERGVKVKIVLPVDYNKVGAFIDSSTNRAFFAFWAQLPEQAKQNIELRNFSSNGKEGEENHTKFLLVDDQWAYVGSQNLDNQSFSFSRELGVGIDDPEQAKRLGRQVFDKDWATSIPMEPHWLDSYIPHSIFRY